MALPWIAIGAAAIGATLYELSKVEPQRKVVDFETMMQEREDKELNEAKSLLEVAENIHNEVKEFVTKCESSEINVHENTEIKEEIADLRASIEHCREKVDETEQDEESVSGNIREIKNMVIEATIRANELENTMLRVEQKI